MDSDDFAHPQKLERQVAQFVKNKQLQGVIHQCIRIDEDSNIEFRGVGSFRMSCISLMIRASVIEKMVTLIHCALVQIRNSSSGLKPSLVRNRSLNCLI